MALACFGCRREPKSTPDAAYAQIEKEFLTGELTKAQEQSQRAYDEFGSRPDLAAKFRLELAKVLIYQGKSGEALPLLQQSLPAPSSVDSEIRRDILLSIAQARLGHLDEAEQTVLEAERQCPDGAERAEVLSARGSIDLERGDLDGAERMFQAALAGARQSGNRVLETYTLMNLGVVALQEEHYEDALASFDGASKLARIIGAKLVLQKSIGNIGWAYYKTGDFQRSLANCQLAEKQAAELGSPIDQGHWLNNAGLSEYRLGDLDAARTYYERSLKLAESIKDQGEILDAHVDLGFLLLSAGNPNAAEMHVREANRIAALIKSDRAQLEPTLLNALLLKARGDKEGASKELFSLVERTASVPSLRWDAENDLAHLYEETGHSHEADLWFRRAIDTFRQQRSSLGDVESTLPFLANGADLYSGYADFLISEHRSNEALNVVDESRAESLMDGLKTSPTKQTLRASQSVNAQAVASRLHATVLVYALRPKISYLWAITPGRQQFFELPGSASILPLVQQQTKAILASRDLLAQQQSPAQTLYEELVKPAESLITKNGRVFIVGDEGLNSLNFETLIPAGKEPHYWIEDVTITNAKSLRLLSVRANTETAHRDKHILLIGNPVYRKDEFTELANAASEVTSIAGHFDANHRTVFTGAAAAPEAYEHTKPGDFAYIHFVAHATASMTSPLDSAVVLSRDHGEDGAYKLYARDILQQGLRADLVTLSACYGSGLRDYSGEGLVGLAWAFLRAGSHQVIGAMWEVSDVSTPELMDHLYDGLAKGAQPDAALRAAKLSMIHAGGIFRKPLYWAPFQLYAGA